MGQFFGIEEIRNLDKTSQTQLTWTSGSKLRVGGQGYTVQSAVIMELATDIDTGAAAANTIYYVYAVPNGSQLELVYSLSSSAPTGQTVYRKIGGFRTDGATEIIGAAIKDQGRVGDIKYSMLDETTFITENGPGWILSRGQNVTGSKYQTATGNVTVPPAAGRFLRAKDHGDGNNPSGDLPLGQFQGHAFGMHNHGGGSHSHDVFTNLADGSGAVPRFFNSGAGTGNGSGTVVSQGPNATVVAQEGDLETRPDNITTNLFIKIDDLDL